ncbi:MAG: hypothetical protein ACJA1Z_002183 [Patiriisocius sp.]|jgi:hypothetical protein
MMESSVIDDASITKTASVVMGFDCRLNNVLSVIKYL